MPTIWACRGIRRAHDVSLSSTTGISRVSVSYSERAPGTDWPAATDNLSHTLFFLLLQ